MYREKEKAYGAGQEGEYLRVSDRLDAPLICGASVGGGGRGRREEGTSALVLCIGGVEAEEDEGLTMRGCLAMERDRKRMEMEDMWWRGVVVVLEETERRRRRYSGKGWEGILQMESSSL
ncbi:uncharacterized protein MONOS_17144 [Monocercomonoides exilis]|uniref:uncharacterized protein n=1 Tax=Monocercomonoides exilis TaxID=2049356 RepID=UPI003559733C|nr:hypothetical protein MONOS_17144 [Monocercomonoides exilis]